VTSLAARRLFEDIKGFEPSAASDPARLAFQRVRDALREVEGQDPVAMGRVVRRPQVAAALRCAREGLTGLDVALGAFAGHAAMELAAEGRRVDMELEAFPPWLLALGRPRAVSVPEGARHAQFGPHRVSIDGTVIELEPPTEAILVPSVSGGPRVLPADPGPGGGRPDVAGVEPQQWVSAITEGLEWLDDHLPVVGRETRSVVQAIVPRKENEGMGRAAPACRGHAPGIVTMGLGHAPWQTAEALAVGLAVSKLHALRTIDPLLQSPEEDDLDVLVSLVSVVARVQLAERLAEGSEAEAAEAGERRLEQLGASLPAAVVEARSRLRPTAVGGGLLDEADRWAARVKTGAG
jgi:HEXXH motif-containing protein